IIGARVGHCVFYDWAYFSQHPWEIFLPVKFEPQLAFIGFRGLASHGGAVGVASALYGFYRRTQGKVSMPFVLDQLARIAPIPCTSIRLGNLMNSEIIGLPTEVPWAFVFTRIDEVPRHPAQLYEAFAYVMGFFLLRWVYHKSLHRYPLSTFALMLIYMFSARFILEFFKENQMAFESMLPLNMGQLLSLPFILVGATLWVYARRTKLQT
ncbi:MAG: prolipoprotein diacylglyceryl transferase, partial [Bacteroidota bacterium]